MVFFVGRFQDPVRQAEAGEIPGVVPLDAQMGVWPRKTVPEALMEPLFGPTAAGTQPGLPLNTYAILDAARVPLLTGMLDASGLVYRCLFDRAIHHGLEAAAPYLAELSPDSDFTRQLFTGPKGVNGLWDKDPGIFLRSTRPLPELTGHLAQCVMVRSDRGRSEYFRFWETAVLDYIGFFGGTALGQKLFPGCTLFWRSRCFNTGSRFVAMRIGAP